MVAKWGVSVAAAARATGKKLKRVSKSEYVLDGCRRTWTSALDATLTSPMMSSSSITSSSSELASLIYSNFSYDHLKSNTKF